NEKLINTVTKCHKLIFATQSLIISIIYDKLTYVSYSIDELTQNASFEEVVYLLWNLELPKQEQLDEIRKDLISNMELPDQVIEHLRSYDLTKVHPMAALRT